MRPPPRGPIPYGRQSIDDDDIAAVVEVLRGDWLTQGPAVRRFEQELARRGGARHAVACNSGTAALHLALAAAGVGPGDEIVCPAVTFLATANAGVYVGAEPRFTDVDPVTGLMRVEDLDGLLGESTRAVLPVHLAGRPCDMPALADRVRECVPEAVIVEDASHALGASHPDGRPVGSCRHADLVVFSFHPVKHVAAGEGGAVLTDDDELARRMRELRSHGMTKDPARLDRPDEGPWYYEQHELGMNYRIPDLNCALATSQLAKLPEFVRRRREIAAAYHRDLADLVHVRRPEPADVQGSSWHLYVLHVDFPALGKARTEVVAELREWGVLTQVHYYPVPLQPFYRRRQGHTEGDFPGAESYYAGTLSIPLFPALAEDERRHVVDALHAVLS